MMRLLNVFLLTLVMGSIFHSNDADASVCMKHGELASYLSKKFEEAPRAFGLIADRGIMEVYVSGQGTWTIVITTAKDKSCIIAAGDTWEDMDIAMSLGKDS